MSMSEVGLTDVDKNSAERAQLPNNSEQDPSQLRRELIIELLNTKASSSFFEKSISHAVESIYNDTLHIPVEDLREGLQLLNSVALDRLEAVTADAEKTLRGRVGDYEGNAAVFALPSVKAGLIRILTHGVQANFLKSCRLIASREWQDVVQSAEYLKAVAFVRNLGYLRYFDLASDSLFLTADDAIGVLINHHENILKLMHDPTLQDATLVARFKDAHAFMLLRILTLEPKQKAKMILSIAGVNNLPLTLSNVATITDFFEAGFTSHAHFSAVYQLYLFATGYGCLTNGSDGVEKSFRKPFVEMWRSVIPAGMTPDQILSQNTALNKKGTLAQWWREHVNKRSLNEREAATQFGTIYSHRNVWNVLLLFDSVQVTRQHTMLFKSFVETVLDDPNGANSRCAKFFTHANGVIEATAQYINFLVERRPTASELASLFTKTNVKRLSKARTRELVRHKVYFSDEDMNLALHDRYFRLHPEALAVLKHFKLESQQELWKPLIPDTVVFWQKNHYLLARLMETGISLDNFARFRALINNPDTREIFESEAINCAVLSKIFEIVGVKENNLIYTSLSSLTLLQDDVDDRKAGQTYRQVLGKKPRLFNAIVQSVHEAIRDAGKRKLFLGSPAMVSRLFMTAEEFGNVTPSIITHYIIDYDPNRADAFLERAREFRRRVHHNKPVKSLILTRADSQLLCELICVVYPGVTPLQVEADLNVLADHCDDLKSLVIREQGYEGKIVALAKKPIIRDNVKLNGEVLGIISRVFSEQQSQSYMEQGGDRLLAVRAVNELLRTSGAVSQKDWLTAQGGQLDCLIAIVRQALGKKLEQFTDEFTLDTTQIDTVDAMLSKARELFGVYYKDNASEALYQFFNSLPEKQQMHLLELVTEKRLRAIENNLTLASSATEHEFKELSIQIVGQLSEKQLTLQSVAHLVALMVEDRFFVGDQGLRRKILRELDKIVYHESGGRVIDTAALFKAYVTKNAASFFAKSVAGVCTDIDYELFNRPDHFHINMVADDLVVGNIQGYMIVVNGVKSFLFRGFNPSSSFINRANCEIVCDQMLDVVTQIARDNGCSEFYIPQQTAWHELTNRIGEGVADYFVSRFCQQENERSFNFSIASGIDITTVYKVGI